MVILKYYILFHVNKILDLAYIDLHHEKLKLKIFFFFTFLFLCFLRNQTWVKYPKFKTQFKIQNMG